MLFIKAVIVIVKDWDLSTKRGLIGKKKKRDSLIAEKGEVLNISVIHGEILRININK